MKGKPSSTERWILTLSLFVLSFAASVTNALAGLSDLSQRLLLMTPEGPDWRDVMTARIKAGEPLPDLPAPETGPPDGAPADRILAYWSESRHVPDELQPTAVAKEKILQAAMAEPTAIPEVLRVLPQNEGAATAIDRFYDKVPEEKRREVRTWIYQYSGLHREEVLADVRHAGWERQANSTEPDPAPLALRSRDPSAAAQVFQELATGDDPGRAVLGAGMLLEGATGDAKGPWRQKLIAAVANVNFPEPARHLAVDALMRNPWDSREEWILSSLALPDPGGLSWYFPPVREDPNHWIPLLVKLLGGGNRAAHDHAVYLLSQFDLRHPRADAVRPLLPWLLDPAWSGAGSDCRRNLVLSLYHVDLPECIDGLIHVIGETGDDSIVAYAAQSLARYKAKQAVPALKSALAGCRDSRDAQTIVEAIHELDGFSHEEITTALEAYFTAFPDGEISELPAPGEENPADPMLDMGRYFAPLTGKGQDLLETIARRAEELKRDRPALAAGFWRLLADSPSPDAAKALAALLSAGTVTDVDLVIGFGHRSDAAWDGTVFRPLLSSLGAARGFAAVLTGDPAAIAAALASGDVGTQAAVLSAARLTGDPLDKEMAASLAASVDVIVSEAAGAYMAGRDEPGAAGWAQNDTQVWDPAKGSYGEFSGLVKRLGNELGLVEGPVEIIALNWAPAYSDRYPERCCLFIYRENAYAVRDFGSGRVGYCPLAAGLLDKVRHYLATYCVDDLPRLELQVMDGEHFLYAHGTANGMEAVFMNNPPRTREDLESYADGDPSRKGLVVYAQLVNLFVDGFDALDLKIGYPDGIQILVPREKARISTVWKQGDDLRVLVESSPSSRHWQKADPVTGKLAGALDEPAQCPVLSGRADLPPKFEIHYESHFRYPWQVRVGDSTVHSGTFEDVEGLWICRRGKEPELVAKGVFVEEVVSPDGKWCVAAKASEGGWAEPNIAVRIDLQTKEVIPIDLKAADDLDVRAFVPSRGKFLLQRSDGRNLPTEVESHLLNPESGDLDEVTGDFLPLGENRFRPLQPTGETDRSWAAEGWNPTVVGKYDEKTFSFTPVKEMDGLHFFTADMWVDESGQAIYAAVDGDLLKIPLR